ncbi:MAG TPA: metallophosphoesterase [Ktedonobacteraceae bacterium]
MPVFRTHKLRPTFRTPVQRPKTVPRFIPIPVPQPANCTLPLSAILSVEQMQAIGQAKKIVFHSVGDTGGINGTAVQDAVAESMESQYSSSDGLVPSFLYHLGDVIYYNGQSSLYDAEFYEPYKYYPGVIFAIPGNHDGDTFVQSGDLPDGEPSLSGFFQNFCASHSTPISTYRDSMTQPYPYWMLTAPFITIIGLYGNVDGTLDGKGTAVQQQWLTAQLRQAHQESPTNCILIAVHQPPYSLDRAHGGYASIGDVIDQAANAAGVWPHAVFSGHVHNYQRFTRTVQVSGKTRAIPYLIAGAGGYANTLAQLHKMQRDANNDPVPCPSPTSDPGVELRGYNENAPGFLRVTVTSTTLTADYFTVPFTGVAATSPFDSVTLNYKTGTITSQMDPGTSGAAS